MRKLNNNNGNIKNTNDNSMDQTYFGENSNPQQQQLNANQNQANTMKRPASLDLNSNKGLGKKQRLNQSIAPLIIDSPANLKDLPFNTPDILEKILLTTPTPNAAAPNQIVVFPPANATTEQENFSKGFVEALEKLKEVDNTQKNITEERENFSNGFVEALEKLKEGDTKNTINIVTTQAVQPTQPAVQQPTLTNTTTASVITTGGMSGGSITYTNLDDSFPLAAIKDEPHQPASPPVSPIDMETQEKIKLERKRQRNRVAASKCRKRKLERISKLEDKVKILKTENADLGAVVKALKANVFQLKQEVIDHVNFGCNIPVYTNGTSMLTSK